MFDVQHFLVDMRVFVGSSCRGCKAAAIHVKHLSKFYDDTLQFNPYYKVKQMWINLVLILKFPFSDRFQSHGINWLQPWVNSATWIRYHNKLRMYLMWLRWALHVDLCISRCIGTLVIDNYAWSCKYMILLKINSVALTNDSMHFLVHIVVVKMTKWKFRDWRIYIQKCERLHGNLQTLDIIPNLNMSVRPSSSESGLNLHFPQWLTDTPCPHCCSPALRSCWS